MNKIIYYIILASVFSSFLMYGCFLCSTNLVAGILLIIVTTILCSGGLIFLVMTQRRAKKLKEEALNKHRQKIEEAIRQQQQEIEEFEAWLTNQHFTVSRKIGDFFYDEADKRWCLFKKRQIYEFSEIVKTKVHKNSSRTSTKSYYSSGSYQKGHRSSNTNHSSYDTSTYDVLVTTSNINYPLITIHCGRSVADAEKISSVIKIIKGSVKKRDDSETETEDDSGTAFSVDGLWHL